MSKQSKFEKNKSFSVKLLSTAALDTNEMESSQYHGLAQLVSLLRAELYENGEYALIKSDLIVEFDKAVKRLFG